MKDIYKNPILYYIAIPILAAIWPLSAWLYLPKAEKSLEDEKTQSAKAQMVIEKILTLDGGRLDLADPNAKTVEFDYAAVIAKVANSCRIPPTQYRLSSGTPTSPKRGKSKSQSADVRLNDIEITKLANFLSTLQIRWASLQCERIKLTKKKGLPDKWDVNLGFKYYY